MSLNRRDLLKVSVFAGAALALPLERSVNALSVAGARIAESALPAPFTMPFTRPPVLVPERTDAAADYYRLNMKKAYKEFIPGLQTEVWGYNGIVPGPTIRVRQGRPIVVRQINNLPAQHPTLGYTPWTSVHLHGQASLPQHDGYASDITNPGQFKDYRYPNWQNGRTLWYHDHGVHHTAENVTMGLAGMYQLVDDLELGLALPRGTYDVPLIVGDRMFNSDGSFLMDRNDESGMYGDVITVNGTPWPLMPVARRKYRFRILNASPSRSYKWSLSTGGTMQVIATDAGLMPAPQTVTSFRHGVAERYEVVIDFAQYKAGTRIVLQNTSPKNNIDFTNTDKVMAFVVTNDRVDDKAFNSVPSVLNPNHPAMLVPEPAPGTLPTQTFDFVRINGKWTINGTTWDDVVNSAFTKVLASPKMGDTEIWELRNLSGGWHHPAHIHFIDFRVLSRNGLPALPHERGAKDVVFLGENESVKLLIKFDRGRGKYMIHCHNLVHEDHDMMGQFEIVDANKAAPEPMSERALWLPDGDL
jgi:FtsP/CotA-like multicopper oxidase with cupredoxin domain